MNDKRFFGILNAPSEKRYRHFLSTAADTEEVWLLGTDGDYATLDAGEHTLFLVFSGREFAEHFSAEEHAEAMEVHEFAQRCEELTQQSELMFLIEPNGKNGYVVDAGTLLYDLTEELARVE